MKKEWVNPYLFLLLKRMLDYEFFGMGHEPTRNKIAAAIYTRHKSGKHKDTVYRVGAKDHDPYAGSLAERIHKYLLQPKGFAFSRAMLDHMVKEVTVIDNQESWDDFAKKYGADSIAIVAARKYEGKIKLTDSEYQEVLSQANRKLYKLHFFRKRLDLPNKHEIMFHDETRGNVIRTASASEIAEIELLARRVYPCPINGFDVKKPWHDKNPCVFYIYRDDEDLWANINLLPLKRNFYNALKNGEIYENRITADDIYSLEEKSSVNWIYIEGLACTVQDVLPKLASAFKMMVASLADLKENLVICAIGGSAEGDTLMKRCGFQRTGWAVDPKDGVRYEFLEISWKSLEVRLDKVVSGFESIYSKEKLTAVGAKPQNKH
ncbi:MAG: hypothetical protein IPJ76_01440 [Flavobacteriales bacterium]|nr:MAG: hypothetical protein IPJ76_01440 [Flavobacteriales bacterium]